MTYTLSFSHIVDDHRAPVMIDGREATITVEADTRTGAIFHADTVKFCEDHACSVRRVTP